MLVQTLNKYDLEREFKKFDRDYFSLDGYQAIIDLFDECNTEPVELDVIAICCDFNEESPEEIINQYDRHTSLGDCRDEDGYIWVNNLVGALNYYTYAVLLPNGNILYQAF